VFDQFSIKAWITIILGKNPSRGGNPAMDIMHIMKLIKVILPKVVEVILFKPLILVNAK
jgi:hypothetical protein